MARRLSVALIIPAALLTLLAILAVSEIRHLVSTLSWVDHTEQVIAKVHLSERLMIDKETGLRGFLITERPEFLQPFEEASRQEGALLDELQRLVADNPSQVQRLAEVKEAIRQWDDYANTFLQKPVSRNNLDTYAVNLKGKMLMDNIRLRMHAIVLVEDTLRNARNSTAQTVAREIVWITVIAALVSGGVLGWFSRRQITLAVRDYEGVIRARHTFLNLASHELRTPVTTLKLQLGVIRRNLQRNDVKSTTDIDQRLDAAQRQLDRITDLITDFLDVNRQAVTTESLKLSRFDLAELVGDVVRENETRLAIAESQVALHVEGPVEGEWDRVRLQRAIEALLSNAIKFGAGHPIEITLDSDRAEARVKVQDHGIGIGPEDQERIFSPFERAVPPENYGGFGLGLFFAQQIVEAHGGQLSIASEVGAGATFTIHLPLEVTKVSRPVFPLGVEGRRSGHLDHLDS